MVTYSQHKKKQRRIKKHKHKHIALDRCPQKKGICLRVETMTPRKPNSALRKIVRVKLSNNLKLRHMCQEKGTHFNNMQQF